MAEKRKPKKGKKNRKHGRNAPDCKIYKAVHRREKNKAEKLRKHLVRYPDDQTAKDALKVCLQQIGG